MVLWFIATYFVWVGLNYFSDGGTSLNKELERKQASKSSCKFRPLEEHLKAKSHHMESSEFTLQGILFQRFKECRLSEQVADNDVMWNYHIRDTSPSSSIVFWNFSSPTERDPSSNQAALWSSRYNNFWDCCPSAPQDGTAHRRAILLSLLESKATRLPPSPL